MVLPRFLLLTRKMQKQRKREGSSRRQESEGPNPNNGRKSLPAAATKFLQQAIAVVLGVAGAANSSPLQVHLQGGAAAAAAKTDREPLHSLTEMLTPQAISQHHIVAFIGPHR